MQKSTLKTPNKGIIILFLKKEDVFLKYFIFINHLKVFIFIFLFILIKNFNIMFNDKFIMSFSYKFFDFFLKNPHYLAIVLLQVSAKCLKI